MYLTLQQQPSPYNSIFYDLPKCNLTMYLTLQQQSSPYNSHFYDLPKCNLTMYLILQQQPPITANVLISQSAV